MKGCIKQALVACTTSNLLYQSQICPCLQTWMPTQRSCCTMVRVLETIFLGPATHSLQESCKTSEHRRVQRLTSCLNSWPGNCVACMSAACTYAVTLAVRTFPCIL